MELARLFVRLTLNSTDYTRGINNLVRFSARQARAMGQAFADAGRQIARIGSLALVGAAGGVAAYVSKIISLGSSAEETASLINVSLGGAAQGFNDRLAAFADTANRSFNELRQGASTIVAMTRAMGLSSAQAGDLSANFAILTTDLGSFFNRDTNLVFEDLQSALAGSSETMQKYGVDVRETTLKNIALERGIISQATDTIPRAARAMILYEEIMRQSSDAVGDAIRTSASFENSLRGIRGGLVDTFTEVGTVLKDGIGRDVVNAINNAMPAIREFITVFSLGLGEVLSIAFDFGKELLRTFGVDFEQISTNGRTWGRNLAIQYASGIAAGITEILRAINQVAGVLAKWFQPNSPPLVAPQIDKWGALAMQEFVNGMLEADFEVLNEIGDIVEEFLRDVAPDDDLGLVDKILGSRSAIAESLQTFRETGGDIQQVIADIEAAVGDLPEPIENYTTALLEARDAAIEVQEAQAELDRIAGEFESSIASMREDIEEFQDAIANTEDSFDSLLEPLTQEAERLKDELAGVRDEFEKTLDPLNQQLGNIRDERRAIKDAQRLAEIEEELAQTGEDALSNEERRLRELERQEIQLQQQIDAEEKRRDTAISGIEDEIKANAELIAQAEQDRKDAIQSLQDQLDNSRDLLEQEEKRRDIAIEAAEQNLTAARELQEKADARLAVATNVVDEQRKQRDLMLEQVGLIERLNAEAEKAASGGGSGGVSGIGAAFADAATQVESVGSAISGVDEKLMNFTTGFKTTIQEELSEIFKPVRDELEELQGRFGGLATFISENSEIIKTAFKAIGLAIVAAGIVGLIAAILSPVGLVAAAVAALTVAWETNFLNIQGVTRAVGGFLKERFDTLKQATADFGETNAELHDKWVNVWWPNIKNGVRVAVEEIEKKFELFKFFLDLLIVQPMTRLYESWVTIWWPEIKQAAQDAWESIKENWDAMVSYLNEHIVTPAQSLYSNWVNVWWPEMRQSIADFWDGAKSKLDQAIDFFENLIPNALQTMRNAVDTQMSRVQELLDPVIGTLNRFIDSVNNLIDAVNRIPSINLPSIPSIPGFADGVTNFSGGYALVGELGPEIVRLPRGSDVIPNNELGSLFGAANTARQVALQMDVSLALAAMPTLPTVQTGLDVSQIDELRIEDAPTLKIEAPTFDTIEAPTFDFSDSGDSSGGVTYQFDSGAFAEGAFVINIDGQEVADSNDFAAFLIGRIVENQGSSS